MASVTTHCKMESSWHRDTLCEDIKNDPDFITKCPDISADIQAGNLELVTLVERLKDLLTNSDPKLRALGTKVLSQVLQGFPADFLNNDSLHFITTFYCDRLKDHHDVLPAVFVGILAICRMSHLPQDATSRLLSAMFLNISCQAQRQTDRFIIYEIFDTVISNRLEDVKGLGPDLVFGIISAMDGERDPRNLMLLFTILPRIYKNLPLGHLTEEAFEVIACYFPVDFRAASEDPNAFTREGLASALAPCLTAIPSFAEFCIPLLLEKLDSALRLAKLDSLHLLVEACKTFTADDLSVHISPLWMSLSREALPGTDREIREAVQNALKALLRRLASSPVGSEKRSDPMRMLLGDVISAATTTLKQVQTNLFLPATHLLLAAAESSPAACYIVFSKVMSLLSSYFLETNETSEKVVLLSTISLFLASCLAMDVSPQTVPELHTHWKVLPPLYLDVAVHKDNTLRKEAVHGLVILTPSLDPAERLSLYNLLNLVVDSEEVDEIRSECYQCIMKIAELYPSEVMESVLCKKHWLPDCGAEGNVDGITHSTMKLFEHRLGAQCHLAALEPFTSQILPKVLDIITASVITEYTTSSLKCLRELVEGLEEATGNQKERIHMYLNCECHIVTRLVNWWLANVRSKVQISSSVLDDAVCIIRLVVQNQNSNSQEKLLSPIILQFMTGHGDFQPLSPLSDPHQTETVALLEAVVGQVRRDVTVPELTALCHSLANLAILSSHAHTCLSSSRLTAALVNKVSEDSILNSILSDIESVVESSMKSDDVTLRVQTTSFLGWVTKGLVLRGYKDMDKWIKKLFSLLMDSQQAVGLEAANTFHLIMKETQFYLNTQSHCIVRLLYRQRFFHTAPRLVEAFRNAPNEAQPNILLALAHLLQSVPQTVLSSYLGQILPLLLESLAQKQVVLLLAALDTLHSLLQQSVHQDHFLPHIQTIIPRLLPLTCYKESMKIRIVALKCLDQVSYFPSMELLPFKFQVVSDLSQCLDDPKRLVRKEAVKTRNRWILLDAPGREGK